VQRVISQRRRAVGGRRARRPPDRAGAHAWGASAQSRRGPLAPPRSTSGTPRRAFVSRQDGGAARGLPTRWDARGRGTSASHTRGRGPLAGPADGRLWAGSSCAVGLLFGGEPRGAHRRAPPQRHLAPPPPRRLSDASRSGHLLDGNAARLNAQPRESRGPPTLAVKAAREARGSRHALGGAPRAQAPTCRTPCRLESKAGAQRRN